MNRKSVAGQPSNVPHIRGDNPLSMTTAELRAALESLGLTQAEAARILGIDRRTIRRYLAGPDAPSGRAIPVPIAKILRLALAGKLRLADIASA